MSLDILPRSKSSENISISRLTTQIKEYETSITRLEVISEGISESISTSKYLATDQAGRVAGILLVSAEKEPDNVSNAIQRAREAKQALGDRLGSVIVDSIHDGEYEGLSLALFPCYASFSRSRFINKAQRIWLTPKILGWLREAAAQTIATPSAEDEEAIYLKPLAYLAEEHRLRDEVRASAARALSRMLKGKLRPRTITMHGDLWLGNILTNKRVSCDLSADQRSAFPFVLIDWGTGRADGYPILDLIRFAHSTGIRGKRLSREIQRHCQIIECEPADARDYLLASLGAIGLSLNCFSFNSYLSLIDYCLDVLSTVET